MKAWDNHEEESAWSEVAFWETGLQGQDNWAGTGLLRKKSAQKVMSFNKSFLLKIS